MPRKRKQTQTQTSVTASKGVTVRMYNGGFGDTFLLTFTGDDNKPRYMLIDCGVHFNDRNGKQRMQQVAENISEVTGNRLHIVAVTHEHTDHLYGFMYAQKTFNEILMDELWLPWTEDPTNDLAKTLKEQYGKKVEALRAVVERLKATSNPLAARLENILSFDTPMSAAGMRGNANILKFLRDRCSKTPQKPEDYKKPGQDPIELPSVKGIKIYVLGPPMDSTFIKEINNPRGKKETYFTSFEPKTESDFAAATLAMGEKSSDAQSNLAPFDKSYCLSRKEAEEHPEYGDFFKKYYGVNDGTETSPVWRRIDEDWLAAANELALNIQELTNNTSLVLAIELTETRPRKVLLFAADAQVGNWLSWQNVQWKNLNPEVSGPDLLSRTVFYKVGHHGSRNATLKEKGLEMMMSDELVAFISVDAQFAQSQGWSHPEKPVVDALNERARGRVIRSDQIPNSDAPKKPEQLSDGEWKAFLANLNWDKSSDKLWIEYKVE